MTTQTATRTMEAELGPAAILNILRDGTNIPRWAPLFADSCESAGEGQCKLRKGDTTFLLDVITHDTAATVDYLFNMGDGRRGGAYIRVTPRPIDGSTITMTVPVGPGTTEDQVGNTVTDELRELIRLAKAAA